MHHTGLSKIYKLDNQVHPILRRISPRIQLKIAQVELLDLLDAEIRLRNISMYSLSDGALTAITSQLRDDCWKSRPLIHVTAVISSSRARAFVLRTTAF